MALAGIGALTASADIGVPMALADMALPVGKACWESSAVCGAWH